jgi:putative phage-type endonuclease
MTPVEREAFLSERRAGIGGSDIAAVFNLGYGCRLQLWREKRGEKPDYPDQENGPMRLGRWLEPHIAEEYARLTGRKVEERGLAKHPDHPELLVHVDRIIWDGDRPGMPGVLEIKALGRAMFSKAKREGLPDDYLLQVQHGMLVTGCTWGAFAVMNRDSGDIEHWDVEAEPDAQRMIIEDGPIFWSQVENGPAPELLEPDDRRCQTCHYRRSCQGNALIQIAAKDTGEIPDDETLRPLLVEYDERKALHEEAEGLVDETKEAIRTAMGERTAVRSAGRPIYFRPQERKTLESGPMVTALSLAWGTVDYDGTFLARKVKDVEERFRKTSVSRPLRVY